MHRQRGNEKKVRTCETLAELISVIVPIYKAEPYLDQCIESITNQTYRNLEIILIDDGSPDKCPEICDRWAGKDPRILVIHQKNSGVSAARNAGIERANGAYIAFVDSDDFLEPEYIEYLYRALIETGSDLSECAYVSYPHPSKNTFVKRQLSKPILQTAEEALYLWCRPKPNAPLNIIIWDKLYRRELIGDERFAIEFSGGEDVLFTCHIFGKCRKIACIDNELYHWRNTPDSASKQFPENTLQSMELLFWAFDYLTEHYPSIALHCKIRMCSIVNGFFYILRYGSDLENKAAAKEKMLSFRRKIHFSIKELIRCSLKDKLIIISSGEAIVESYIRFRHFLNR